MNDYSVKGVSPAQTEKLNPLVATVLGTDTAGSIGQVHSVGSTNKATENAGQAGLSKADLQKGVDKLNQLLAGSRTRVEIDAQAPKNRLWLNVVEQSTGQVIQRFPPEGLRNFMETSNAKGLTMDLKL